MKIKALIIITFILLTSCINKKIISGQVPDPLLVTTLKVGIDDKNMVEKMLGSPSFEGNLGDNSFYYVGSLSKKIAFLDPKLIDQKIIQLEFDKLNKLKNVYFYNAEDRDNIEMSEKSTVVAARKIGFLEQLFSGMGFKGTSGTILQGSGRTGE
tara:strand:- start:412 stop:873 length:462 start_codon:yes stop_codon:yes gene_type:complete